MVVALAKDDGSLLELREVTSGKLIQRFHSPDNPSEELEFDFRQRLLALSGQKRIELWNLEEIETKTTPAEISRYRIWQQETKTSGNEVQSEICKITLDRRKGTEGNSNQTAIY